MGFGDSVWELGHPAQSPCLSGVPDWPRPKPVVCTLWGPGFTLHLGTSKYKGNTDSVPPSPPFPSLGLVQADKQFIPTRTRAHSQDLRVQDGF